MKKNKSRHLVLIGLFSVVFLLILSSGDLYAAPDCSSSGASCTCSGTSDCFDLLGSKICDFSYCNYYNRPPYMTCTCIKKSAAISGAGNHPFPDVDGIKTIEGSDTKTDGGGRQPSFSSEEVKLNVGVADGYYVGGNYEAADGQKYLCVTKFSWVNTTSPPTSNCKLSTEATKIEAISDSQFQNAISDAINRSLKKNSSKSKEAY